MFVDFQVILWLQTRGCVENITHDSYNFLWSSFCIVFWRWLLAILL